MLSIWRVLLRCYHLCRNIGVKGRHPPSLDEVFLFLHVVQWLYILWRGKVLWESDRHYFDKSCQYTPRALSLILTCKSFEYSIFFFCAWLITICIEWDSEHTEKPVNWKHFLLYPDWLVILIIQWWSVTKRMSASLPQIFIYLFFFCLFETLLKAPDRQWIRLM